MWEVPPPVAKSCLHPVPRTLGRFARPCKIWSFYCGSRTELELEEQAETSLQDGMICVQECSWLQEVASYIASDYKGHLIFLFLGSAAPQNKVIHAKTSLVSNHLFLPCNNHAMISLPMSFGGGLGVWDEAMWICHDSWKPSSWFTFMFRNEHLVPAWGVNHNQLSNPLLL